MQNILDNLNEKLLRDDSQKVVDEALADIKEHCVGKFADYAYVPVIIDVPVAKGMFTYAPGVTFAVSSGKSMLKCLYDDSHRLYLFIHAKKDKMLDVRVHGSEDRACRERGLAGDMLRMAPFLDDIVVVTIKQKAFGFNLLTHTL